MYHWLAEDQTMELACNTIDEVPEDLVHLKTFQKYLLGLCQNRGEKNQADNHVLSANVRSSRDTVIPSSMLWKNLKINVTSFSFLEF